MKQKKNHT